MINIKKIGGIGITVVVVASTLINIKNQFNTLGLAKFKNEELKVKLEQMDILESKLVKKIEYATSSAFIDSQRKELLGLGTENDYWLEITEDGSEKEIVREINETRIDSNIEKWWKLFTQ